MKHGELHRLDKTVYRVKDLGLQSGRKNKRIRWKSVFGDSFEDECYLTQQLLCLQPIPQSLASIYITCFISLFLDKKNYQEAKLSTKIYLTFFSVHLPVLSALRSSFLFQVTFYSAFLAQSKANLYNAFSDQLSWKITCPFSTFWWHSVPFHSLTTWACSLGLFHYLILCESLSLHLDPKMEGMMA